VHSFHVCDEREPREPAAVKPMGTQFEEAPETRGSLKTAGWQVALVVEDYDGTKRKGKTWPQACQLRGKVRVACAAEVKDRALCRIRLRKIANFSKASLHAFVEGTTRVGPASRPMAGPVGLKEQAHEPQTIGSMPAHIVLRRVDDPDGAEHRVPEHDPRQRALGAPGVLKPETLGARRLSRASEKAPANLSQ
jgi:hypothetical protein